MVRHSRVLLVAVAFCAATNAATPNAAAQRTAAAEKASQDADDQATAAQAKLRTFAESLERRNSTIHAPPLALSIEENAARATEQERTAAGKVFQLRIGVLRSAATDASASEADTQQAIKDAQSAAALVRKASDHQRQDMSRGYRKLQGDEKAKGRSLEKAAMRAAKAALRAARTVEKARRKEEGEGGEKEYEHGYAVAERRDEDLMDSAENLRGHAEDATERFYDHVESLVEHRMDALSDEASRRGDEQDRTIDGLRHTAEQRVAAAGTAAPTEMAAPELSGNLADVSAGRAPLLLVLALGGLVGGVTFAFRRAMAPRRIAEPALLG